MSADLPAAAGAVAAPVGRGWRALAAAGAAAYAGFIYWLSSRPDPLPFVPKGVFSHDKVVHASAYAVLGALLALALAGTRLARGRRRLLATAVVLASLYGASDEWHQAHVPHRQPDAFDWAADSAGALAGAALAAAFLRRRSRAG
ncbi:VanZ family protein [Anaeromyxobacter dehalogenans 2CP-1]|uniref:VanZ family protein n=1 Tax=Anaeromyxobacter dehalogenans (strain ATCC BAA-258 / DSM 21875 / 2CP-1) TaxID=455488 RepID=B8J599_ANAD2|nr:VanZ family protein [Anaeromyxobacter dehalogenans]ACL64954.1 VanZ family protein [Anaeromyxobacter dehalogenans 2CP-1]